MMRTMYWGGTALLIGLASFVGCSDDQASVASSSATTTTSNGNGGTGGTGGSSSSNGGGGMGGDGGGGGMVDPCLDDGDFADAFALELDDLCVVATHDVDIHLGFDPVTFATIVPTWGRHGGPLTMVQESDANGLIDDVTLTRWGVPDDASSALTSMTEDTVTLGTSNPSPFMNPDAVDLPYGNLTALGWAEFGSTAGELVLLDDALVVVGRIDVAGIFSVAGIEDGDRVLLHSSLSELDKPNQGDTGLYVSVLDGDNAVVSSDQKQGEGDASGPIALDADDNLVALYPSIGNGTQVLRGLTAAEAVTASGSGGELLADLDGSGTQLAAMAPSDTADGYAFVQGFVGGALADPVVQPYTVDGDKLAPQGDAATALTMAVAGAEVTLMTDDQGRLWVGYAQGDGTSTFYVIDRRP